MRKINGEELKNIFKGIASKQEKAFNELYEKYHKLIYGIAFSILKNKENSEDVMQIVFTKIWNMDQEKLPSHKEATWLYSLVKNETLNFLRKQKNVENIDDIYCMNMQNNDLEEIIESDSYHRMISKLNEKEQEIVSLKILADLSFKEISQILNIPIGTVQWRYYKSLHTLKILLSNLSMFIVTITLFITQRVVKQSQKKNEELSKEESIPEQPNNTQTNTPEVEEDQEFKGEAVNETEEKNENVISNETTESIIVPTSNTNITFVDIGILSLSSIFLIITIIFTIIFVKHQQKCK